MLTTENGYAIMREPKKNRIVITLPQIMKTIQGADGELYDRQLELIKAEEMIILSIVEKFEEVLRG